MTTMSVMPQKAKPNKEDSFEFEDEQIPNQSEMDEIYDIKF
jgi:hypothetical protein